MAGYWEINERSYSISLRCGEYYTATGILMDMISRLLGINSLVNPETGGRLHNEDEELMGTLAWLLRDPEGEKIERWLAMLSEDPQSIVVLTEVVEHAREDFRRMVERDEREAA